jgi:hypothetical protein
MTRRAYVAVLATLAVAGLGWVGWEQHRQTEQQAEQSCLARATAHNATDLAFLALTPLPDTARSVEIKADVAVENKRRLDAC